MSDVRTVKNAGQHIQSVTAALFISTIDLVLYQLSPLFCLRRSSHRPVTHEDKQTCSPGYVLERNYRRVSKVQLIFSHRGSYHLGGAAKTETPSVWNHHETGLRMWFPMATSSPSLEAAPACAAPYRSPLPQTGRGANVIRVDDSAPRRCNHILVYRQLVFPRCSDTAHCSAGCLPHWTDVPVNWAFSIASKEEFWWKVVSNPPGIVCTQTDPTTPISQPLLKHCSRLCFPGYRDSAYKAPIRSTDLTSGRGHHKPGDGLMVGGDACGRARPT
ncbi:hypothetical protein J6590_021011 [Homalodisca vitripennis]|nr:hypothetical protein J6590_021011 [Homalodisca vitripennis]